MPSADIQTALDQISNAVYSADALTAKAQGFIWQTFSRNPSGASSQIIAGTVYYSLFTQMPGKKLTNLAFDVVTAGNTQTLTRVAVCDATTGAVISQSADVTPLFQGVGIVTPALASPVSVTIPTAYYAAIISVGGVPPFLIRGNASNDADRFGANSFSFGRLAGQVDIPATGPNSGSGPALWVAGVSL